jgi:hypothetical protein
MKGSSVNMRRNKKKIKSLGRECLKNKRNAVRERNKVTW